MSRERLRAAGLAAALAAFVLVPLAIWGAWSLLSEDAGELGVETLPGGTGGGTELIVSLPSDDLNDPDTASGEGSVGLECVDDAGEVEFRVEHLFPFTDTDGGTEPPHVHQRVTPAQLSVIERCRLEGTTEELAGEVQAESAF